MHGDDELPQKRPAAVPVARDPARGAVEDPEEWADYWSEELVTLYHGLEDHARAMGTYVLDRCTFPDFVEFCFKFSSGRRPPC